MNKSTWIKLLFSGITSLFFGVITIIGLVADLLGVAEGVEKHKELFQYIISFLASWWKSGFVITVLFAAAYILIRKAYKEHNDYKDTMNSSWFNPHRRITRFSGGEEHLIRLRRFLKQGDTGLSWWAITGVAGIGKTRLVIEALNSIKFDLADVRWIKSFDDYKEENIRITIDDILKSANPNNIIIAEDAQIYMNNLGMLIEYFENKKPYEKRNHSIKLLLLIRMGEDEDLSVRYKRLESTVNKSTLERTCFNYKNKELKIERYEEEDIADLVKSYLLNTSKKRHKKALTNEEIISIQKNTILTLRSEKIDPVHLRPLFAMFIADALLEGKEPASWDRRDVLEYAIIDREDEFLKSEMKNIHLNNSHFVIDKIRGIICLSIIRNGIIFAELDGIRDDLEKELGIKGVFLKDFLKDIQLMGKDGIIRIQMPDILSEYYALRTLVIEPEDGIVEWIIEALCDSTRGVDVQRQKIRQDFKYLYGEIEEKLDDFYIAFFRKCSSEKTIDIIDKLLLELDLGDSNAILLHDAVGNQINHESNIEKLSRLLCNALITDNKKKITDETKIEDKRICFWELERLQEKYDENKEVIVNYAKGLYAMIFYTTDGKESRECLEKLNGLLSKYNQNTEVKEIYCKGLNAQIKHCTKMEDRIECLSKLSVFSKDNKGNESIDISYSYGLYNMIIMSAEIKKRDEYLLELKRIFDKYERNEEIVRNYCSALYCICDFTKDSDNREKYVRMIEELSTRFDENESIAVIYADVLVQLVHHTQDVEMTQKYMARLEDLKIKFDGNDVIYLDYYGCKYDLYRNDMSSKEKLKLVSDIGAVYERNKNNILFALTYSNILNTMIEEDEANKYKYSSEKWRILSVNPLIKAVSLHDYNSIDLEAFSGAGKALFRAENPVNIG